jgi:hypothetical protein
MPRPPVACLDRLGSTLLPTLDVDAGPIRLEMEAARQHCARP